MKTLLSLALATFALTPAANAWSDSYWDDDNDSDAGQNRQTPKQDPVDTKNAKGKPDQNRQHLWVKYDSMSVASYHRLCDFVARVKLSSNDDIEMEEKAYVMKQVVRSNRTKSLKVPYRLSDSPGFKFIRDSQQVLATCLRWKGGGVPNPQQNPDQRPGQTPNQVCNPETDSNRCGNTCQANPQRPSQCQDNGDSWPNDEDYWS